MSSNLELGIKAGTDPLLRPSFGIRSKALRLLWSLVWCFFFRIAPTPFHGYRCTILRLFGARIGSKNFIYPSTKIWAPWLLETGDIVTLGPNVEVYNPGGVRLGHHTIVSQGAFLCGATHDYNSYSFDYVAKMISMEPYTWICARAILLPGVVCGEGSVLGAGSVISRNMEPWSVYAGNPAVLVKKRTAHPAMIGSQLP
jgi:putative colanic acid biosynthesis acetyltransferase WcaF